jgi:hypothetical protein
MKWEIANVVENLLQSYALDALIYIAMPITAQEKRNNFWISECFIKWNRIKFKSITDKGKCLNSDIKWAESLKISSNINLRMVLAVKKNNSQIKILMLQINYVNSLLLRTKVAKKP